MLPHERELMTKYGPKGFTILGVNSDQSRSALKKTIASEKISWPNIWGGPTNDNRIARDWQVTGWPTIYLIDHEGVIRHSSATTNLRGAGLERAIEELLEKRPQSTTRPAEPTEKNQTSKTAAH